MNEDRLTAPVPEPEAKGGPWQILVGHQDMAIAGAWAYNGGLGQSPQRGPGAEPWSGDLEVRPQKPKAFLFLDIS